jgi:hypothetical protein
MPPSTQDLSTPPSEPTTASKEREGAQPGSTIEETIQEDDSANATPKDIRFWLIIMGLLVATFISALDLTGKNDYFAKSMFTSNFMRHPTKPSVPHSLPSPIR